MARSPIASPAFIALVAVAWIIQQLPGNITVIDPCPSFELAVVDLPAPDENDPLLVDAEHILEGFYAPEDGIPLGDDGSGHWIWSMGNGDLLRVNPENKMASIFAHTGEKHPGCGAPEMEARCGRPLGLLKLLAEDRARYQKYLDNTETTQDETPLALVADAYKGLLLLASGGSLVSLLTKVDEKPLFFANALARAKDGTIYLSDSSARFRRNQVLLENLESRPTGRIVRWNPDTGASSAVVNNLPFPNGLVLRDNDRTLLVSLTTRHKIVAIDLGSAAPEPRLFAALPGVPDNMHLAHSPEWNRSVLWVGTATKSSPVTRVLNRYPLLRRALATLPRHLLLKCFLKYGLLLALDPDTGELLRAYQDPTGGTAYIAGVHFDDSHAYIGSWQNRFLARIPRQKLFAVEHA